MSPHMENTAILIYALNARQDLLFQYVQFPVYIHFPARADFSPSLSIQQIPYLTEYPRPSKRSPPYHDSIHAITFKTFTCPLRSRDVPIPNYRNMHTRIILYLTNQSPVGLTCVHLRTGSPMNGERLNATVLQLLGQVNDYLMVVIPSQACLHRYQCPWHSIYDSTGDSQHLRHVLQHTCSSPLACHFLYGATEIQVQHIGVSLIDDDSGGFAHGVNEPPVDLNGNGTFIIGHLQLFEASVHHADEGVARHEFRIHHGSPHLPA